MALIKCPECGNEVSDKADRCPHCGVNIASMFDIMLCCPHCLSSRIDPVNKKFSAAKAAMGYICVGNIGVLAGAAGINKEEFTCRSCGNRFKGSISPRLRESERDEVKAELIRRATQAGEISTDEYIQSKLGIKPGCDNVMFKEAFFKQNQIRQYRTESEKETSNSVASVIISFIIALMIGGRLTEYVDATWAKILVAIVGFVGGFIGILALLTYLIESDPNKKNR